MSFTISLLANKQVQGYRKEMSRKRLRTAKAISKRDPAYWRERLFKNAFTYKGRRSEVRCWSVKIQLLNKRKSFTLSSQDRAQAAGEACQIYQTIIEQGWEAVTQRRMGTGARTPSGSLISPASISYDAEYWKHRLIHRKYPETQKPQKDREFAVRMAHGHTSHYFPLGTSNENEAAGKAMGIYGTIVNDGWERANQSFPRELALGLRWQDNPLAWTYTTFHTRQAPAPPKPVQSTRPPERSVVFIEPDAGVRYALATYANGQDGFRCDATFVGAAEAKREILRRKVDLVLVNHELPDEAGRACFEEMHRIWPGLVVLPYSVFTDADELFKSTPGGSVVYLLKRTSPWRLFEPIVDLAGPVTHEQIASHVRDYFQRLSAMLPSAPPFWKLAKLTPREQEILALLSKGELLKEIAGALGISNWTVQGHVKSIFEKLKVHNRTEAVVKYLQR